MVGTTNGWETWKNHVLLESERIANCVERLEQANTAEHNSIKSLISENNAEIRALKVKAGIWGAIGGFIPVLVAVGVFIISKLLGG